jgi:hypothetical protein
MGSYIFLKLHNIEEKGQNGGFARIDKTYLTNGFHCDHRMGLQGCMTFCYRGSFPAIVPRARDRPFPTAYKSSLCSSLHNGLLDTPFEDAFLKSGIWS